MDDIQYVMGKTATQEELFEIFYRVCEKGLLVISSNQTFTVPLYLRLKSRYGNLHESLIYPADRQLRVALIRRRAAAANLKLEDYYR